MIQPARSPVAPRVISPISGDVTPLVDQVEGLLVRGKHVRVRLEGEANTMALGHLAAVLPEMIAANRLRLDDESQPFDLSGAAVTVVTSKLIRCDLVLRLCGWSRDDFIEYLLAVHPDQCRSVMSRLKDANLRYASGSPAVWRLILDRMAADPTVSEIESIVVEEVHRRIGDQVRSRALADMMLMHSAEAFGMLPMDSVLPTAVAQVLSEPDVAMAFTNERFIWRLRSPDVGDVQALMSYRWPWGRLTSIAKLIDKNDQIPLHLIKAFGDGRSTSAATCATLLCLCDQQWKPSGKQICLRGGRFDNAQWAEIDLRSADLNGARFCNADLTRANFKGACLRSVDFSGAVLRSVDFSQRFRKSDHHPAQRVEAGEGRHHQRKATEKAPPALLDIVTGSFRNADLSCADLSGRCFQQCDFVDADLTGVRAHGVWFEGGRIDGADFSGGDFSESQFLKMDFQNATIDGSSFYGSDFVSPNLDAVTATNVSFQHCGLSHASMTASTLTACNFHDATLVNARLAEIDWQDCDLRDADLRGCTFHLGSTRCGMVDSPYPSHGTRTGFYTDDFDEQYFKSPETIRKANLCGSDLRGADITGVDFYLVDLRGAKFDPDQRKQFVASGAILDD
ncbi:Pentapeptide repeats (8 copies) [Stieleria neptunia]|uniref:Pentapeptide repeats (8 copies) n=1 Tax=Stieleria neptunia TaxID=2527979 RepID=A0A518HXV3_9BACT|nr:pentapeptide repeat-containing protein [Stieleria neptunia]QDV45685.1 Pentapeptide repeats (8 copies) [Stieleria neptunia]